MKLTVLPKTLMYTPKTNLEQKHVNTTQEHEKGALLLNNSPRGRLTCSGELGYSQWRAKGEQTLLSVTQSFAVASEHCSVSRCSSPWRADYLPWRVMTVFCREVRFFTPKTRFSSTPIPKFDRNSTYDHSTT